MPEPEPPKRNKALGDTIDIIKARAQLVTV